MKQDPSRRGIDKIKDTLCFYNRLLEVNKTANTGFSVEDKRNPKRSLINSDSSHTRRKLGSRSVSALR